jgi:hypothetical protein
MPNSRPAAPILWWQFTATGLLGACAALASVYLKGATEWTTRQEVTELIERRSMSEREQISSKLDFISQTVVSNRNDHLSVRDRLNSQIETLQQQMTRVVTLMEQQSRQAADVTMKQTQTEHL